MLHHWVSEGEFYIGSFVINADIVEPVRLEFNELVNTIL